MKVEQFENKNQFIIYGDDGSVTFQSYFSECAQVTGGGTLLLGCDWDYSQTTLRHLYLFLKRFFVSSYKVNPFVRKEVESALNSTNKRKALQDLLNRGVILKV